MAKLEVVITEDGLGYYLSQGDKETGEAVDWGDVIEFEGKRYIGEVSEDGEDVTLSEVVALPAGSYEAVAEGDDEDDDDDEEAETEDEEETDDVIIK